MGTVERWNREQRTENRAVNNKTAPTMSTGARFTAAMRELRAKRRGEAHPAAADRTSPIVANERVDAALVPVIH